MDNVYPDTGNDGLRLGERYSDTAMLLQDQARTAYLELDKAHAVVECAMVASAEGCNVDNSGALVVALELIENARSTLDRLETGLRTAPEMLA